MALYHLTNKGNVVQCKIGCDLKHEHYLGTYSLALKYFGIEDNGVKSYGKLINVIFYHQTDNRTFPKLSNELFDILIKAQSEHKYWSPEKDRQKNAFDALKQAEKEGLLYDEKLLKVLKSSDRKASQDRVWAYEKWMKSG